jgi:hypothetical protein
VVQFPGNFVSFVKVPPQMEFLLQDRYKICSLALNFVAIPKLFYLEQIVHSTDSDNSPSEPQVQNLQNERLSSENSNPPKPVPRPRTKIVQRSKSQRPSVRQSTDLSQLSAINSSQNSILENGIGKHFRFQK